MNQISVLKSTLKRVGVFRPLKFLSLPDKGLVFSCKLTFENKARLFFAIHKFSSRVLWPLHCAYVYPLGFVLLFDLHIGLGCGWGNILAVSWWMIGLRLVLKLCLFFDLIGIFLGLALKFGLLLGDLDVFVFSKLIFSVRTRTFFAWFGENLWIQAWQIRWSGLRNQFLKSDSPADVFQFSQFLPDCMISILDSFLNEFGLL